MVGVGEGQGSVPVWPPFRGGLCSCVSFRREAERGRVWSRRGRSAAHCAVSLQPAGHLGALSQHPRVLLPPHAHPRGRGQQQGPKLVSAPGPGRVCKSQARFWGSPCSARQSCRRGSIQASLRALRHLPTSIMLVAATPQHETCPTGTSRETPLCRGCRALLGCREGCRRARAGPEHLPSVQQDSGLLHPPA